MIVLTADELLSDVVADGRTTIRFADRLYTRADQQLERTQFLQTAMERLALDREIDGGERLYWEAHASAGALALSDAGVRTNAIAALQRSNPGQTAWRLEYINWLLEWRRHDEAHQQAITGRYFSPDSEFIRAAVDRTALALARGGKEP